MATSILTTKLYVPPLQSGIVSRPQLLQRLSERPEGGLILLSAPAGFGKTTLLREWIAGSSRPVAWLSLDEGDNEYGRFLTYLCAALQSADPAIGHAVPAMLRSPRPPADEALLTELLNEIAAADEPLVLVLDDYHLIDSERIHAALGFMLEHLPPKLNPIIATREDPPLPLARLRGGGRLRELRAGELRFSFAESADFLGRVMGLSLSEEEIGALEERTEGWIAGLQMAALSMQGREETAGFIASFTGSHRFVLDYLVEEVLRRQPPEIQHFLLATSVLDRLCGPLCDALLYGAEGPGAPARDTAPAPDSAPGPSAALSGQKTLEYLEKSNLFIVPLDGERRWYRYHHLFADLLWQRAWQRAGQASGEMGGEALPGGSPEELHRRASSWYEGQGYAVEAFRHAAAAGDVQRAIRLIAGEGMPLQFRGAVAPVLGWLESLPRRVLDTHPSLWVTYASTLSMTGRTAEVEDALRAAEAQLPEAEEARDAEQRNLIGHIAAIRALLAAASFRVEEIISQSERALQYLHPGNLAVRTATTWKLGIAYQLRGELETAARFYEEAVATGRRTGNTVIQMAAALGLAGVQEEELRLYRADETYREVLKLAGELPMLTSSEACLGLARIRYQWNDTEGAKEYGRRARQLARTVEGSRWILPYEFFMARMARAGGDLEEAEEALGRAEELIRRRDVEERAAELAGERLRLLLLQGRIDAAERLAEEHELPLGRARVELARGDCAAALEALMPMLRQAEEGMPAARRIRLWLLHALALAACGEEERALERLGEALARGEGEGCLRIFLDEGEPLRRLLSVATARYGRKGFTAKLLSAFRAEEARQTSARPQGEESQTQPLIEPLSSRELEILQLIDRGCSNQQIAEQLFLALSTVKGHNRNIFEKLAVRRRTEAVARARELGLI